MVREEIWQEYFEDVVLRIGLLGLSKDLLKNEVAFIGMTPVVYIQAFPAKDNRELFEKLKKFYDFMGFKRWNQENDIYEFSGWFEKR